ncbi:Microcystin-dependent protein [Hahella chejuensis KCTC 2396]|uniref:Microcystin-dependent protein n=1 Tax=Hahella chejuensis (strain KCTC 2396) TaxID=349521 RepID=Q2S9H8_HAHCH|nr:tail fiber protein [Hahella chejuensis]ABB69094.1 hypothetical protein [Hahella chejuensis KCTC 2396]ABC32696.1 Microcystin-dependent protein [Hahella chejuensis KCTC 2396]
MSEPFIAEVRIFSFDFPPASWAYCDGQLYAIGQNPALFSLIGTLYGGDGRTTMGLPNLQCRSPLHAGTGLGLTPRPLSSLGGTPYTVLDEIQIPPHTHALKAVASRGTTPEPQNQLFAYQGGDPQPDYKQSPLGDLVPMHPQMLANTGNSGALDNRQPFLTLSFCIALDGIYPPRN